MKLASFARTFVAASFATMLSGPLGAHLATAQTIIAEYRAFPSEARFLTRYDVATQSVAWTRLSDAQLSDIVVTADGTLAVALGLRAGVPLLRVIDTSSGASFDVPVAFAPRAAHPSALAVFGLTDAPWQFGTILKGTAARLDAGGITRYGGCAVGTATDVELSGDGRLVFVLCESGAVSVLDAASGALLRTVAFGTAGGLAPSVDGSTVVVGHPETGAPLEIRDSTSGAVLASVLPPDGPIGPCAPVVRAASPDRTVVVFSCSAIGPGPFPPVTVDQVLRVPSMTLGPTLAAQAQTLSAISPDNHQVFSTWVHRISPAGGVTGHDLSTGATTLSVFVVANIGVGYAPLTPTLAVNPINTRVNFSWTLPPFSPPATSYLLDVGSAPGLTDIVTLNAGTQSAFTVQDVPPGRYFVRLRAVNGSGSSAATNEIVVAVP